MFARVGQLSAGRDASGRGICAGSMRLEDGEFDEPLLFVPCAPGCTAPRAAAAGW